ncbi:hypothetical protein CL651_002440 [bacterium]|nr:hypothetical protein [bacterium]
MKSMVNNIDIKSNFTKVIVSLVLSTLSFVYFCDIRILDPTFNKWLMPGDSETYWLNWLFYQESSLIQIPIFKNYNYGMELSSTIALNDSLPIMAFVFKIFQSLLPVNSQYFGIWIYICFFLQSLFAMKLLNKFSDDSLLIIIYSIFFLLAPIFLWRLWGHYSLMAHWLILGSLNIYFNKDFKFLNWLIIFFFSYLVSAYIAVMMFIIFATDLLKRKFTNQIKLEEIIKLSLIFIVCSFVSLYLIGYIDPGTKLSTSGFGFYKANLLTFFDSNLLWSNIFSDIKSIEGEHEGFAFLGSGVLLLALIFIPLILYKRKEFKLYKVAGLKYFFIISILLLILALSNNIHIADYHLLNIDLPKFIEKTFGIIRASGRMVWIPFYLIYILLFIAIDSFSYRKLSKILIILALTINIIDLNKVSNLFILKTGDIELNYKEVYSGPQHFAQYEYWEKQWESPLKSKEWKNFAKIYNEINYIYPKNRPDNYFILALYAAKNKMSVNFGSFSRVKKQKVKEEIKKLKFMVNNNNYNKNTLYYFNKKSDWELAKRNKKKYDLVEVIDGFMILAPDYFNKSGIK